MNPAQVSAVVLAALDSLSLSPEERRSFQDFPPAGFTLFKRNIAPALIETRQLTRSLQALALPQGPPLIIAIDQEGGRVARLKQPFPDGGAALYLADGGSSSLAEQTIENHAFIVGSSLLSLGVNVNFAPVLDIFSNPENLAIGDRCFGLDAATVQVRAHAYQRGLQAAGVKGCLKHFPGQGDAGVDTHTEGAIITASLETLHSRELQPFLALLHESPMLMVSHAVYPALDAQHPASLSAKIMQDLLRQQLQYQGLIVTDDMNMKAISQDQQSWSAAVVSSVAAGADLVLVCKEIERFNWAVQALAKESRLSPAFERRLVDALDRTSLLRMRLNRGSSLAD